MACLLENRTMVPRVPCVEDKDVSASLLAVRRLAVARQHLPGSWPVRATGARIVSTVRDLGYVQLDPIELVAPAHVLTLWNRLGNFRRSDLDRLLWKEKRLFEAWSHATSIVPTADYPIHYSIMHRYPESLSRSWGYWRDQARRWLRTHAELRRQVLGELRRGPRRASEFEAHARTRSPGGGWSSGSDVTTMLTHLQLRGEVIFVGRGGNQKTWGLAKEFLPSWVDRRVLPEREVERRGVERSVRALGVANSTEINTYLLRGRYLHLRETLEQLRAELVLHRIRISGIEGRDPRYVHHGDLPLLESLAADDWEPRVSLLSPFDNLLHNRDRVRRLFGFDVRFELYVPKSQRRFGPYVLPILWGDRFIGRLGARFDKDHHSLRVLAVHAEPGAPPEKNVGTRIAEKVDRLGELVGASEVTYEGPVPDAWSASLH